MSDTSPTEDLRDLYDNAPCGYLSLSPNGNIVKLNRTLLDWVGRNEQDLLGRSIHEILGFGGKIAFETHLAPLLRLQGFVYEIALDLLDAEGEKIPVIANAAERRGDNGEHLFTRLTVFRAVDRRTFERSLIEARTKAEEQAKSEHAAIALREQFIAVLGHDLRNPLAALTAGIRMLKGSERLSQREEEILHEMGGSIGRANGLIDDLMDFARGRLGGGIALEREAAPDLRESISQIVTEMRNIHGERDIRVSIDIGHEVSCDPGRIGQLVANLLGNAVAHGAADCPIELDARTTQDTLILSVVNGGQPIPQTARDHLFEPFFRADLDKGQKGLGLGLFIVSEIARAHDGSLDVASDENETRFTFTMPRAQTTESARNN